MRETTKRLKFAQVEEFRRGFLRSVLLFLTDRCPVGCSHCSVDSRPNSPSIDNFSEFDELVDAIAALTEVELVGISGGEPFVERRGLKTSVAKLRRANKLIVLYTSGIWATRGVPPWVEEILAETSAVFLSTDAFHSAKIGKEAFVRAARTVSAQGPGLIVQVVDQAAMVDDATNLLAAAFGQYWEEYAELHRVPPLPYGRGEGVFSRSSSTRGSQFGPCTALAAPVIRYDGVVTACCNEQIITGHGPDRLRRRVGSDSLDAAMASITADPFLQAMRAVGPGPLTAHPRLASLATEHFHNICDLCWKASDRFPLADSLSDPALNHLLMVVRDVGP